MINLTNSVVEDIKFFLRNLELVAMEIYHQQSYDDGGFPSSQVGRTEPLRSTSGEIGFFSVSIISVATELTVGNFFV